MDLVLRRRGFSQGCLFSSEQKEDAARDAEEDVHDVKKDRRGKGG